MAGFSGLGLGYLGDEKKYIGEPGPSKMPDFLNAIIETPKAYAAKEIVEPSLQWIKNKFSPAVPPGAAPMAIAPTTIPGVAPIVSQAQITSAIPAAAPGAVAVTNEDHPELNGLLKTNPYTP